MIYLPGRNRGELMGLKVGDRFKGTRKGSVVLITEIKSDKIKFEIQGAVPIFGATPIQVFKEMYVSKGRVAA